MMMRNLIIWIALIVVLTGGAVFVLYYNKPHRSSSHETAAFTLSAGQLIDAFANDEEAANARYLDKMLEVHGPIKEWIHDDTGVILLLGGASEFSSVSCKLEPGQDELLHEMKIGDRVQVKGICSGALLDVVLSKCIIKKDPTK
jgi:hypothetical protein